MRQASNRLLALLLVAIAAIVATAFVEPLPQPLAYHDFADQRTLLGVPNFWNVVSNLPFLFVGIAGMWRLRRSGVDPQRMALRLFFFGVALTAFGSGYFHLAPDNFTLVWDRLPMTIGFMALFSFVMGAYISPRLGRGALLPLLLLGLASVAYWHFTEQAGLGDLRFYGLVQFLPMLLIPLIMVLFRATRIRSVTLIWVLVWYGLSKVLEHFDDQVFSAVGLLSGHSLKHLAAAVATAIILNQVWSENANPGR